MTQTRRLKNVLFIEKICEKRVLCRQKELEMSLTILNGYIWKCHS